ncbi:uncharacterized protein EDB93DRAFT_1101930 [Suillus bovinus]|uniref:uncharacterized protein n=1 Tax=Suillus bovinus TaxID=48563 RepID=UPI001B87642A|nr:uncharacterized protein EDB93DRAFT_1101930 [Suillus bovinus]KAG2155374.1 hypothetical protein EDB93DRAFT_1101930 [Suillus bovinus]
MTEAQCDENLDVELSLEGVASFLCAISSLCSFGSGRDFGYLFSGVRLVHGDSESLAINEGTGMAWVQLRARVRWYQDYNLNIQTVSAVSLDNTIGACEVYHETHTALKPLINSVHTKEDLDELLQDLDELQRMKAEEARSALIHDPPVIQQKGCLRHALSHPAQLKERIANVGFVDGRDSHG